jgi:hypothetical protein
VNVFQAVCVCLGYDVVNKAVVLVLLRQCYPYRVLNSSYNQWPTHSTLPMPTFRPKIYLAACQLINDWSKYDLAFQLIGKFQQKAVFRLKTNKMLSTICNDFGSSSYHKKCRQFFKMSD